MRRHQKHLHNAKLFLNSALNYKENDCAVDALSRVYYACFHSMLAYLHFRDKGNNLPEYIGHSELRDAYCDLYDAYSKSEKTHGLRPFVFFKDTNGVLRRWQRLREDADYKRPWETFDQLSIKGKQDFYLTVEFAKAHINYIEKADAES